MLANISTGSYTENSLCLKMTFLKSPLTNIIIKIFKKYNKVVIIIFGSKAAVGSL